MCSTSKALNPLFNGQEPQISMLFPRESSSAEEAPAIPKRQRCTVTSRPPLRARPAASQRERSERPSFFLRSEEVV